MAPPPPHQTLLQYSRVQHLLGKTSESTGGCGTCNMEHGKKKLTGNVFLLLFKPSVLKEALLLFLVFGCCFFFLTYLGSKIKVDCFSGKGVVERHHHTMATFLRRFE